MRVRLSARVVESRLGDAFYAMWAGAHKRGPFVSQRIAQAHVDRWNRDHPPLRLCPTCKGAGSVEQSVIDAMRAG